MDIPNLSQEPIINPPKTRLFSLPVIAVIIVIGLISGFAFSRVFPKSSTGGSTPLTGSTNQPQLSTDSITSPDQLKVGQLYGDLNQTFKDTATGVIQKGGINGVGTHTLIRDGGPSQSASLTSSTVDLDLFVGKKVEVKGETNAAAKTGWLMDVGSIKILQ
jgi:hypothetical protein